MQAVDEAMMNCYGYGKEQAFFFFYEPACRYAWGGIAGFERTGVFHFGKLKPRKGGKPDGIGTLWHSRKGQSGTFFDTADFLTGMVCKGLKVGVIIEKAEAECTVVTTYGRRNTYFVVFYDAFPVCAQAESLGGIGTDRKSVV